MASDFTSAYLKRRKQLVSPAGLAEQSRGKLEQSAQVVGEKARAASAFKPKDTATSISSSGSLGSGKIGVDFAGLQRDRDTMAQDRQSLITERAQLTSRKVYNPETTAQNRERLAEIESQLGEIEARRDTLDYYEKYKDTQRDDSFLGQFQANYDVGRIQQEEAKAWNEYLDNPTQANREKAEALSTIMSDYVNRNTSVLDEEGAVLPAVTQTLAQYLPQFVDQTKEQIKGGLAGAATGAAVGSVIPGLGTAAGAVKGAKAGVLAATGVYSHDTMRGMAFKGLLDLGVDEETARAAANDEALISSLIEMADTGIDIATLGVGNLLNSLAKNGVKGAAKSLAVGAGVKAGVEKVTSTSLGKIATVLGRYGLNILSEGLEEYTQEAVSIANENRVSSGSKGGVLELAGKAAGVTWDAATGKDPESAQRMNEAFAGGATIAAFMGGATMVGTSVAQRSLQKISDTSTGKDLKRAQENFDLVDRGLTYAQDSESYTLAQSIARKLDSAADPMTAVADAEYGKLYRAMQTELDTKGPKTGEQRHDAVQAMHPDEKVITPTAQAFIDAGESPARADAKSVILDRVLSGDDTVTDAQLRKLDLQSPVTRQVFTAFTGIQVPATTDTKTLLATFRSAISEAKQVQQLQAALERDTMASVTALRQKAEEAAVASENRAQAQVEAQPAAQETVAAQGIDQKVVKAAQAALNGDVFSGVRGKKLEQLGLNREDVTAALQQVASGQPDMSSATVRQVMEVLSGGKRKTTAGDVFRPKGEIKAQAEPAARDTRPTPDVQLSDGTSMTAQEFVNNYIATHDGATVQDANRVYSEAVRLNQTGMKFPAARKRESTAARSSVSPSSRKSRSEGKRTTGKKAAAESAVQAERTPSRVQRWTASYASALLRGSKIQGIDIAFDGFGEGERGYYLDGRIVLNGNTLTTQRAIMQVLGHELTHSAYDTDASIVDDILTTARRILGNDRVDRTMTETRERYIRFLTEQKGMSRDAAVAQMTPAAVKQEVAGDFMFDVFSDGALTRRLGKEAPTILKKARDMAARLLERLAGVRGTDAAAARSELEWLMDRLDGALRANEAGDTMGKNRSSVEVEYGREGRGAASERSGGAQEENGNRPGVQSENERDVRLDSQAQLRERHARLTQEAADYGLTAHIREATDWPESFAHAPAYTSGGEIYIREDVPDEIVQQLIPHEATHAMRQVGYPAYMEFIQRVPEMLDLSTDAGRRLLAGAAAHRGLDIFNLTPAQADVLYDEINAILSGTVIPGTEGSILDDLRAAFYDFDAYAAELRNIHERFREENRQKAADTAPRYSVELDQLAEELEQSDLDDRSPIDVELQRRTWMLPEVRQVRNASYNNTKARPGRRKIRQKVLNELMERGSWDGESYSGPVSRNRRADIVIGLPGSGKSSMAVNPLSQAHNSRVIDSDMAKELLPEYDSGKGAGNVHEESSMIRDALMDYATEDGDNLVWATVGANQVALEDQIEMFKQEGYSVYLHLVDVTPKQALARTLRRFHNADGTEGRYTPPRVVFDAWDFPRQNFMNMQREGGLDGYQIYDNRARRDAPGEAGATPEPQRRGAEPAEGAPDAGYVRPEDGGSVRLAGGGGDERGAVEGALDYAPESVPGGTRRFGSAVPGDREIGISDDRIREIAETESFQEWFHDGKGELIDQNTGLPVAPFHGTKTAWFTRFEKRPGGEAGFWFAKNPHTSDQDYYTGRGPDDPPTREFAPIDPTDWAEAEEFLYQNLPVLEMELESDGGRDQYVVRDGLDGVILRTFTPDDTGLEQFKASYPELAQAAYEMQSEDEFSGMVHSDGGTPPPAPGMYQVFLSMRNPMVVHAQGQAWNKLSPFMVDDERTQRALLDRYNTLKMIQGYVPPMETRQFAEMAQELGYDGVIFRDVSDGRVEDIVQPALERPGLEQKLFDILERYNNFGAPDQEMALAQIEVTGVPGQVTMEEAAVIQEYLELPEARTTLEAIPDDVYVVFDSEQIKSVHNEGTFDPTNPDIRYSVSSTQPFAEQVRTALEEDVAKNRYSALYIRSTPSMLRELGLPDAPMAMTARHVKDINHAPGDNLSWHGIPEEQIARIPELLDQPAMVLESGTRPGDIIVVTTELDSEGRPIVLTVHPNGRALVDGRPVDTNFITSMYGRNNFGRFLDAVARNGGVLYWDKNRSQDLLTAARVQFPAGMRDLASNSIIRKIGGAVNENRSRPLSSVARVQSPAALTASASDTTISQPGTDVNGERVPGTPRFSIDGKPLADPLYSQMENAILDFKGEKIGAQSLVSYLKGHGVKDEEIKWSGITGFLEGKKSVPKQELVDFLRANELVIEDTVLGDGYDKKTQAKLDAQEEQLDELVNGMREKAAVIFPDEDPTDWSPYQLTNALRDRFLNSEIGASNQEMTDVLTEAFKLSSEYDTLKRRHERDIETALNAIDPVYEEYKLDGGENYREILFRLPNAEDTPHSPHWEQDDTLAHTRLQDFVDAEGKKVLFVEEVQSDWHQEGREHGYTTEAVDSETFMDRSPEYQEALDNAVNANTKFYEELQRSEFAYLMDEDYADDFDLAVEVERVARQEGLPKDNPLRVAAKKYLLASERATTLEDTLLWTWRREVANRVPDAPYRTTWHEYVMKRILRMAAENGYDKVAWTTGKMQSDRYGLQKQIGGIEVYSNGQEGGSYRVEVSSPSGRPMQGLSGVYSPDKLTQTFGKDLGRRMMEGANASPETGYSVSGEGLSIGGEGMHNFYDVGGRSAQNLPKFLNKYLKPWGVKVETSLIGRDLRNTSAYRSGGMNEVMRIAKTQDQSRAPYLVPSVDITPEMRDDLLYKGQPRFSVQEGNVNPDTGYETGSVADSVMRMINAGDVDEALKMMGDVLKQFQQIEADQVNRKKQASAAAAFRPKQSLTEDLIAKNKKAIEELIEKYGSMEQTSAAQRTVLLPKAIDKETKVRGVMQTAAATENTPEYLLSEIERSILDGDEGATYVSIGDKGSLKRAENLLKDKGFETLLHEWRAKIDAGVRLDKTDIVMAEKLYVEAANNKDTATAMQLLSEIAMAGTQSGQIVQAMTMLKNMTPSGQLYYLQKTVDRFNTEHKDLRLLGKEIAIDPGLARKLLEAKTQEEIDTAMGDLIQNIADQLPVTLLDRWNAWRYLAMLGNPRTHIRNLFGNAIFTPARLAKDVLATAGERLLQSRGIITQEERTKAFSTKETRDFAKADSVGMERILRGGGKQNIADQIRDARKIFGDTPIEWLSRKNSELLEWEDWIFLRSAYEHALAGFLSARKADVSTLSGADSTREGRALLNEARAYAVREAQKATYRDVSKLASMLSHLKRTGGPAAQIFLDGLIPFTKTPINIVKRGVEYSPVGLLKSITVDLNRVRKGEISATEAVDNICAGLTGTGIVAMGYVLAKMGILVGGFGDEPEDEFQELQGEQSYSLRLGDVSYTIDWTAPVALPLFVGAEIDRLSAGEFSAGDLPDAIATLLEPVLSLSMLDGLNSTLASVRYDSADQALVNILKTVGGSYLTQGVPTLAGQIARTMDDSRRTSFTPTGMGSLQSWASRTYQTSVLGKIPVASEQRMLYIDAWGRSDTEPNIALRALENFLSPGYANTIQTTSVDRELIRLAEETKDTGVFPKRATKYFTVGGEQYAMTQDEYEAHLIERGQMSYQLVSDLTSTPDYAKLPDAAKVQAVQAAYTYASELAKYHTNAEYDADSWVLRLDVAGSELGLDPEDYFIAKALSKQNGSSIREAALGAGFDPATTAAVIAADFSAQGSFTDPYTPKHEYVLNSEQKERYESMFREKFVSAYIDYGLGRLTGTELSDEVSDLVSEINTEVKREMSDWLYGQGISPTQKK